ncbi:Clusterin-associated protein 1 [Rhizophlyctis rosea]|nr:Clusterin-associated protein 1 [Rhizophlyctis rosea]
MADGYAVKELLKIVNVLYEASTTKPSEDEDIVMAPPLDISSKIPQLKTCRLLATDITERGATLYDLLGKEMELRDIRTSVISRPFDLRTMEVAVSDAITLIQDQIATTRAAMENLAADETNLMAKIEKKKMELERAEKRLRSLAGVRPAYMDEYEKIEVELSRLYEIYMEKFRNLTYLEQQLDEHNRLEQDKFEETEMSLKQMQSRLREEELRLLRGDKEMRTAMGAYGGGGAESARPKRPNGTYHSLLLSHFIFLSQHSGDMGLTKAHGCSDFPTAAGRRTQSLILRSDSESDDGERSEAEEVCVPIPTPPKAPTTNTPPTPQSENVSLLSDEDAADDDDIMLEDDDRDRGDSGDMDDVGDDDEDHIVVDNDDEDEEGAFSDDERLRDVGLSGDDNDF